MQKSQSSCRATLRKLNIQLYSCWIQFRTLRRIMRIEEGVIEVDFSLPQRLPLGIPIKIAIIQKIESARGTMGSGKRREGSFPFPSCPARCIFLSPQPPYNTKRPLWGSGGERRQMDHHPLRYAYKAESNSLFKIIYTFKLITDAKA